VSRLISLHLHVVAFAAKHYDVGVGLVVRLHVDAMLNFLTDSCFGIGVIAMVLSRR